ncbi:MULTISPECIES: hemerythrin domain-containing protein [unclassified Acidovorax]|uniref:hemerythrin domain-containing protein n=1 Tax=unclassified Acidovorax TaxID=2684926 RepID=UPI002882E084|nr:MULTISPECIES: hemerythrin domain-containing protein [unclassified Acidovorax]
MAQLEWSLGLALDLPLMDTTHQEFVELLAAVQAADDAALLPAWHALVHHTVEHFGQEDRWMQSTRFASSNCHSMQHRVILQVLGEGTERAEKHGELQVLRGMASELAVWFPQHTQSMDAALALHLRRVGFDPVTGQVAAPAELPAALIEGCGSACSGGDEDGRGHRSEVPATALVDEAAPA